MNDTIIKGKYEIIKVLGQDSLTETYLALGRGLYPFKRYVIKKFRPILGNPQTKETKDLFAREANILKLLSGKNPQIPLLHDCFMDGEDVYLIREWIEGVTLEQKVQREGKLSQERVIEILSSILSALEYIHDSGFVYGELSPSSIVLRQQNWSNKVKKQNCLPVLIYFSGIKELEQKTYRLNRRSLVLANQKEYVSPEQRRGESVYASDFYSLGLTAIYLLTGKTPAELKLEPYTDRLLWHHEVSNPTINLARVIDRAISPNISDRFTSAKEMLNALHPQSVVISKSLVTQPLKRSRVTPEVKIITALFSAGLGIMVIAFALINFDRWDSETIVIDIPKDEPEPTNSVKNLAEIQKTSSLPQSDRQPKSQVSSPILNIPVFQVGTPQTLITNSLGKPTYNSRGYWGNSRAFLYKNFAQQQIDLGYLFDVTTQTALQTEVSFAESVRKADIERVLQQLLMNDYSTKLEQQIERVIKGKSDLQKFSAGGLQGVIQRNSQNRIYVAVWQKGFHN